VHVPDRRVAIAALAGHVLVDVQRIALSEQRRLQALATGLFTPRSPLTIGMIAERAEVSDSLEPRPGAASRLGAYVEPSVATTTVADASWCRYSDEPDGLAVALALVERKRHLLGGEIQAGGVRDRLVGRGAPPSSVCIVNRRPKLRIVAPSASPEEAAAVVAALERFMRDTAPTPAPEPPAGPASWARSGLLEATGHDPDAGTAWGRGLYGRPR